MPQIYAKLPREKINNIFKDGKLNRNIAVDILPDNMHDFTIVSDSNLVL
jgi:hypothetical protein